MHVHKFNKVLFFQLLTGFCCYYLIISYCYLLMVINNSAGNHNTRGIKLMSDKHKLHIKFLSKNNNIYFLKGTIIKTDSLLPFLSVVDLKHFILRFRNA